MVEECISNRDDMNYEPPLIVPEVKSEAGENGCRSWIDVVEGSSEESMLTYRRRKRRMNNSGKRVVEDGSAWIECSPVDQTMNGPTFTVLQGNPYVPASIPREHYQAAEKSPNDTFMHWKNHVLKNIYLSIGESEGSVNQSIVDEPNVHTQSGGPTSMKAFVDKSKQVHPLRAGGICNEVHSRAEGNTNATTSNGVVSDSNHYNVNGLCQHVISSIVVSEKFSALCKLVFENFQRNKVDSLFDFSIIYTRMKEGAYENSPILFLTDIQQVWSKVQNIGTEMASLAEGLLEASRSICKEKLSVEVPDRQPKLEHLEACQNICTCHQCGEKSDSGDCLVCDSCEEVYHISCIEPVLKESPPKSWFCTRCTASGIKAPHENCVVCASAKAKTHNFARVESEENLNCTIEDGLEELKGNGEISGCCIICKNETKKSEKIRLCGHELCPNKYYHIRCLTSKQLISYGPRWYCPSCICGVCLNDKDDDMIVLCDGCDHAYHIYCTQPSLNSIPRGNWFCTKCDAGLQEIRKRRREYEINEKQLKHGRGDKKIKSCKKKNHKNIAGIRDKGRGNKNFESCKKKNHKNIAGIQDKGRGDKIFESCKKKNHQNIAGILDEDEGVDMLLNAAKTLNIEENLAACEQQLTIFKE